MADRTATLPALRAASRRVGVAHAGRLVVLSLLLFAVVACSDDNVTQAERATAPTPIAAPSGVGPGGEALTLEVIDGGPTTGLIITDHLGFVVYGVVNETINTPVCVADCLDAWLPLAPRDAAVASALDIDLYRVFTRADGIEQVAYADVPLYRWTGDREVGITGGANVAGIWYPLTETGGFVG